LKILIFILILFSTFSFANEGDSPLEEKISLFFDISVEKCTLTPHECVSGFDLRERKVLVLKRTPEHPEHSDGWLTLTKTLYGTEYICNFHLDKLVSHGRVFYSVSVVLYYVLDGDSKTIQFSSGIKGPNDLDIITLQGPSFGRPELNYAPVVIFGGTLLEEKNEY
jgi:hypothetical protein